MRIKNKELELAWNFVEKTDRSIFLTGKAGTGKTTFLHQIKENSLKRLVVVAPTGVAAINAKGVTIHSFFQMPFGPIIPGVQIQQNTSFKMKFNRTKIDIIRSLDLLIIDEISMVRADLLDGIDQVLRRYKDRNKVFGGVQVLMIGDLQQLSPVVKPNEWNLLKNHYQTAYFFSSKSFQEVNAISIELKYIYRQDNEAFIAILNEIRNNKLSEKSAKALNERFQPDFTPKKKDGYITLTTHNNRAKRMNEQALNKLKEKSLFYSATVSGKFNEHAYPTHDELELKVGAQVMFIKNDSSPEKRYFNGKIGQVTFLDKKEVIVQCPNDDEPIVTTPEIWENVNYTLNEKTKEIKENLVGSFTQIPLRLAWAITIHKSQGLTFDKAIIDAEASFAHGQTYVALSRCRTLEGVVLKSKITHTSIISDHRVSDFTDQVEENKPDEKTLSESQKAYQLNLIEELFSYRSFLYPITRLIDIYYNNRNSIKGKVIDPLELIKDKGVIPLMQISNGFKKQLLDLSNTEQKPEESKRIQERITKAIAYFIKHSKEFIKDPLDSLTFSTKNKEVKKNLNKQLQALEELVAYKNYCLAGLTEGFETQKYLKLRAEAVLQKNETQKRKKEYVDTTKHKVLFEELRLYRTIVSQAEDIPLYQIFTQQTLYEICRYFPLTSKELRAINGMGKIRVEKYGVEIIEVIKKYISEYTIEINEIEKNPESKPDKTSNKKASKGSSQRESLALFKSGKNTLEIATQRGLAKTTIEGHLSDFILTGEVGITQLIPQKRVEKLRKIITKTKFEGLSELKTKVGDAYSYGELRMMLKALEYENSKK